MIHFVECKPDERLLRCLGVGKREIVHENDKGRVFGQLRRRKGQFAMVDKDPTAAQPGDFRLLRQLDFQYQVRVYADDARGHREVILCPSFEERDIPAAKEVNVRMEDFNLSSQASELHGEINHRLDNLERLCEKLLEVDSPMLVYLQSQLP